MQEEKASIIVMADTHAVSVSELPIELREALKQADYIIHLGDFTSLRLVRELQEKGRFYGVAGNHDGPQLRRVVKDMEVINISGKSIGLIHGMYWPFGAHRRMKSWFRGHKLDVLLYGHSHEPSQKMLGDVLLFNPGTASGQFPATRASFGILTVNGTIDGKIYTVERELPWGGTIHRLRGIFLRFAIAWIYTWPYLDLVRPAQKVWRAVADVFRGAARGEKGRESLVPVAERENTFDYGEEGRR